MKRVEELGISPMPWESHKQFVIAADDGSVVSATNVRDARLIAAAPKMYECLYDIVKELCEKCLYEENSVCKGSKRCYVQRYKKVLAKATGEEVAK